MTGPWSWLLSASGAGPAAAAAATLAASVLRAVGRLHAASTTVTTVTTKIVQHGHKQGASRSRSPSSDSSPSSC